MEHNNPVDNQVNPNVVVNQQNNINNNILNNPNQNIDNDNDPNQIMDFDEEQQFQPPIQQIQPQVQPLINIIPPPPNENPPLFRRHIYHLNNNPNPNPNLNIVAGANNPYLNRVGVHNVNPMINQNQNNNNINVANVIRHNDNLIQMVNNILQRNNGNRNNILNRPPVVHVRRRRNAIRNGNIRYGYWDNMREVIPRIDRNEFFLRCQARNIQGQDQYSYYLHYLCARNLQNDIRDFLREMRMVYDDEIDWLINNNNLRIFNYQTPIHTAVQWNNNVDLVRLLIENGADFNIQDGAGNYPEESIENTLYVNYFRGIIGGNRYPNPNVRFHRNRNDFIEVINELRRRAGEMPADGQ